MPQVFELADVVGDHAGQRDIQQGEQPGVRPFDDISPECGKGGGARRTGVYGSRYAVCDIGDVWVDAIMRHAPEVVNVEIDQPRRDDETRRVKGLSRVVFRDTRRNRCDRPVDECNVGSAVDPLRRVDDGPAFYQEVIQGLCPRVPDAPTRIPTGPSPGTACRP